MTVERVNGATTACRANPIHGLDTFDTAAHGVTHGDDPMSGEPPTMGER